MARKLAAAVALGKRRMEQLTPEERTKLASTGGKAGGKARAKALTPARRKAIATKASAARLTKLSSPKPPMVSPRTAQRARQRILEKSMTQSSSSTIVPAMIWATWMVNACCETRAMNQRRAKASAAAARISPAGHQRTVRALLGGASIISRKGKARRENYG